MSWKSRCVFRIAVTILFVTGPTASYTAQSAPIVPDGTRDMLVFRLIAFQEAKKADLPFDLVDAVMKIESNYHPEQIGGVGEIGLMQVRPATAAMMGFRGAAMDLADPATNIHFGTTYLGQAWHLAHGDVCRTLMKYRAGHGEEVMSPLSSTYCARAKAHLAAINSPLAALITPSDLVATLSSQSPIARSPIVQDRPQRGGSRFWTAFQSKIKAANARVEAKWKRMAAR